MIINYEAQLSNYSIAFNISKLDPTTIKQKHIFVMCKWILHSNTNLTNSTLSISQQCKTRNKLIPAVRLRKVTIIKTKCVINVVALYAPNS